MLVLDPRSGGQYSEATDASDTICFVRYDGREREILINSSMLRPPVTSAVAIGVGLCRVLHLDASLAASTALLLSSMRAEDCQRVLSDLRVSSDDATLRESSRGCPGMPLSDMDKKMIELKPFRAYRLGEVVAFDKNENGSISDSCPFLCYGRVVTISDEGEAAMRRISLKTDTETVTLLPTSIYSFKSARDPSLHADRTPTETYQKMTSMASKLLGTGKRSSASASAALAQSVEAPTSSHPHADQTVSRQEVVGALSSLLHRAGVPLSLEKQVC